MNDVFKALVGSRKFWITAIVLVSLAPLVATGKMSLQEYTTKVEHLAGLLVAAIAIEGAAEKWNASPPPPPPVNVKVVGEGS